MFCSIVAQSGSWFPLLSWPFPRSGTRAQCSICLDGRRKKRTRKKKEGDVRCVNRPTVAAITYFGS